MIRRLQAEKANPLGDIIWGVSRSLLQTNKALFLPYASKNKDAIPAEYRDPDDLWIGNNLHLLVILQNTKLVPDGQGPKSWADLLDPKWKGKIAWTYDLTEQKRQAQDLANQTAVLEAVLENMDQGITMYDADLRLVAWNRRYSELAGIPEELLTGRPSHADLVRFLGPTEAGVDGEVEVGDRLGLYALGGIH